MNLYKVTVYQGGCAIDAVVACSKSDDAPALCGWEDDGAEVEYIGESIFKTPQVVCESSL